MLTRYCEKHFDALADKSPLRDCGDRVVDLKPDPGEQCSACKEPASRLAEPLPKDGA